MTPTAPKGLRMHVAILGRRDAGKSSLLNAITRQDVAIVSPRPGTTTDPVEKPMELPPLGPVLFIDTAGIDDTGDLGGLRVEKTRRVLDRADLCLLVADAAAWGRYEDGLLDTLADAGTPAVVVLNKADLAAPDPRVTAELDRRERPWVAVSATTGRGIDALRGAMVAAAPAHVIDSPPLLGDLVRPGELAVLVTPIDKEAPKGRLILPQVQAIRDLLDHDAACLVVKERELRPTLGRLRDRPALVVTDSQAFLKVAADTPPDVPMTSFSILFARAKGDLTELVRGATSIDRLGGGDRVLVCEACAHHPIADDIGRVKIPRWLRQHTGAALEFVHTQGHDFPDDPGGFALVVHCGACIHNRRAMLGRILRCRAAGVPVTNYGLSIAYTLGIFERALGPFPAALEAYRAAAGARA